MKKEDFLKFKELQDEIKKRCYDILPIIEDEIAHVEDIIAVNVSSSEVTCIAHYYDIYVDDEVEKRIIFNLDLLFYSDNDLKKYKEEKDKEEREIMRQNRYRQYLYLKEEFEHNDCKN